MNIDESQNCLHLWASICKHFFQAFKVYSLYSHTSKEKTRHNNPSFWHVMYANLPHFLRFGKLWTRTSSHPQPKCPSLDQLQYRRPSPWNAEATVGAEMSRRNDDLLSLKPSNPPRKLRRALCEIRLATATLSQETPRSTARMPSSMAVSATFKYLQQNPQFDDTWNTARPWTDVSQYLIGVGRSLLQFSIVTSQAEKMRSLELNSLEPKFSS